MRQSVRFALFLHFVPHFVALLVGSTSSTRFVDFLKQPKDSPMSYELPHYALRVTSHELRTNEQRIWS